MQKIHHYFNSSVHHIKNIKLNTPIAIIIGAIIIAGGIVTYGFITTPDSSSPVKMFAGKVIDKTDFVDGKSNGNIFMIEYSDTECPYCTSVHSTLKQLRTEYSDKIGFVYRHFPLTQIHPHAFDEATAITCAGTIAGEKKYYEYIDTLFGYKVSNKTTQLPATGKEDTARGIGIDTNAFASCLASNEAKQIVNDSLADGVKAGVQGTPTTFLLKKVRKGYEIIAVIDGARPYEYFKAAIEEALGR